VADADAGVCLRYLTELERAEIESLDASRTAEAHLRTSQKRLAEELTRLVHGEAGLSAAQRATQMFFEILGGAEITRLSDGDVAEIFANVPSQTLAGASLEGAGLNVVDAFVSAGLAKSKGEARRTMEQGGAYVNNRRIDDVNRALTRADLASETTIVLRSGKKKYALLRFD
jgi:tyrosyl-tRNA synthetase